MRHFISIITAISLLFPLYASAQDPVIQYSDQDSAMNGAIKTAQETFGEFMVQYYKDADETGDFLQDFGVKVGLTTADGVGVEHIWVSPFIKTESGFFGLLSNEPVNLAGLGYGSEVAFTLEQISDWSYVRDGRAFGNFTTRVMLPDMAPETLAAVSAYLAPAPIPEDWAQ